MDKRWPAHNATTGEIVGYHCRKDLPDGTKDMYWEDASGNPGLNGFHTKDLALYPYPIEPAGEMVVVEGEKCYEALKSIGIPAVGTVCGAPTCPGDDALLPLVKSDRIVLWPDNDDAGRKQMSDIARRLHALGATNLYTVSWTDAPDKGDCADAIVQGVDVGVLIAEAAPIPPPFSRTSAAATLTRAMADPTERSIPALMMTSVIPIAAVPTIIACTATSLRSNSVSGGCGGIA